jgi:hypothetical protein
LREIKGAGRPSEKLSVDNAGRAGKIRVVLCGPMQGTGMTVGPSLPFKGVS